MTLSHATDLQDYNHNPLTSITNNYEEIDNNETCDNHFVIYTC